MEHNGKCNEGEGNNKRRNRVRKMERLFSAGNMGDNLKIAQSVCSIHTTCIT